MSIFISMKSELIYNLYARTCTTGFEFGLKMCFKYKLKQPMIRKIYIFIKKEKKRRILSKPVISVLMLLLKKITCD